MFFKTRFSALSSQLIAPVMTLCIMSGATYAQQSDDTESVPEEQVEEVVEEVKDMPETEETDALGEASYNIEDCQALIANAESGSGELDDADADDDADDDGDGEDGDSEKSPVALDLDRCKALVK
ncbi:MAG: hypothetical protein HKN42_06870 [Granulosicoccus sp.]|nr:hypothetical protein [Granulosicoccus sp.]